MEHDTKPKRKLADRKPKLAPLQIGKQSPRLPSIRSRAVIHQRLENGASPMELGSAAMEGVSRIDPETQPTPQRSIHDSPIWRRRRSAIDNSVWVNRLQSRQASLALYANQHVPTPLTIGDRAELRRSSFQRFRAELWKKGEHRFRNDLDADAIIIPVPLEEDKLVAEGAVPSGSTTTMKVVRAVVHSAGREPIVLKRSFDVEKISATVPEPAMAPCSPIFNRDTMMANLSIGRRQSQHGIAAHHFASPKSTRSRDHWEIPDTANGWPIHLQYARAQVPILAAFLMSPLVRRHDVIELPVPYPASWLDTVAFLYTGEDSLVSAEVRLNVRHLGGKL